MSISKIGKLTLASGENSLRCGVLDKTNGFVYFLCHTAPGKVVKVRLSDFAAVGTLTFALGVNSPRSAVVDSANEFMYVCCYTSPGKIVKIRLSDFTVVGTLTFPPSYDNPWSLIINLAADYLYAFCYTATYHVVRVALSTFSVVGYLTLTGVGPPFYETARPDLPSGFGYCGTISAIKVAKINLPAFSLVASVAPASGGYSVGAAIDLLNGFYFCSTDGAPAAVSRVILSSFLSDSFITLASGENTVQGMCTNPAGKLLYAFCYTLPGRVVRINISTFTRKDVFIMATGDNYPCTAVIDEPGKTVYVGTDTSPGTIIKLYDGDIVPPGSQHLPVVGIG